MARSMVGAGFEKGGNWVRSMGTHLGGWRLYQSEAGPSLCWRGRGGCGLGEKNTGPAPVYAGKQEGTGGMRSLGVEVRLRL